VVKDADDGMTLIGANILIEGTVSGTITDFDGNFTLKTKKDLPFNLVFSLLGYGSKTVAITENNQVVDLSLSAESIIADEIIVSASRVEESILQSPVTIEKLDLIAIQQSASADYYDEISKLKGVHHTQASVTFNSINARGFAAHGNTRFVQLQDGIDNAAPLLNFPTGSIVGIPDLDIKNVELIPGASSALYGPNAFNGILLMTSKDPFNYQGLSAQLKSGVTDGFSTDPFYGASIRYAKSFNDKFAFKVNGSLLKAQDWQANDYESQRSPSIFGDLDPSAPAFDGINTYGDESAIPVGDGMRRTGFKEEDLLESRKAESYKANAALHYRITDNLEANLSYQWGSGSSVYQGSERYALRGLSQVFTKVELNSDKWNIKAYRSQTDAGDSYNLSALGAFVNEGMWRSIYDTTVVVNYMGEAINVPMRGGWAVAANLRSALFGDQQAKAFADAGGFSTVSDAERESLAPLFGAQLFGDFEGYEGDAGFQRLAALALMDLASNSPRLEVGSPEFNALVEQVRSGLFQRGGAGFIDDSYMDHVEGTYDLSDFFGNSIGLQTGGNFRRYSLFTDGTVFNEDPNNTGVNERIKISEYGAYLQASKDLMDDRLKLQASMRYDKNQNFEGQVSPRVTLVYSAGETKNHNIRVSYQTGFRNPTTQGQYIYFPTTNILLGGTRENAEQYGIFEGGAWSQVSYNNYLDSLATLNDRTDLDPMNENYIDPESEQYTTELSGAESLRIEQFLNYVKPEKLQTFEIGYKGITNRKLFLDASFYYNIYNDFITQNNVINKEETSHKGTPIPAGSVFRPYFNAPIEITSYGFAASAEYLLPSNWKVSANYTFNDFSLPAVEERPLGFENYEPGFNTPTNKINVGIANRKIIKNLSGAVNVRWQNEHYFNSSFGEGLMPAYTTVDAQVGYKLTAYKSTVKLGISNLLKNTYRTNYGGPFIGRMIHLTITYDQFAN